jgi:hypothetical protein
MTEYLRTEMHQRRRYGMPESMWRGDALPCFVTAGQLAFTLREERERSRRCWRRVVGLGAVRTAMLARMKHVQISELTLAIMPFRPRMTPEAALWAAVFEPTRFADHDGALEANVDQMEARLLTLAALGVQLEQLPPQFFNSALGGFAAAAGNMMQESHCLDTFGWMAVAETLGAAITVAVHTNEWKRAQFPPPKPRDDNDNDDGMGVDYAAPIDVLEGPFETEGHGGEGEFMVHTFMPLFSYHGTPPPFEKRLYIVEGDNGQFHIGWFYAKSAEKLTDEIQVVSLTSRNPIAYGLSLRKAYDSIATVGLDALGGTEPTQTIDWPAIKRSLEIS